MLSRIEKIFEEYSSIILIIMFFTGFIFIVVVYSFYSIYIPGDISSNKAHWGQFGDYIGGILNPIMAFLALTALTIAIILQRIELKTIKKEMKLTVKIADRQVKHMESEANKNEIYKIIDRLIIRINESLEKKMRYATEKTLSIKELIELRPDNQKHKDYHAQFAKDSSIIRSNINSIDRDLDQLRLYIDVYGGIERKIFGDEFKQKQNFIKEYCISEFARAVTYMELHSLIKGNQGNFYKL